MAKGQIKPHSEYFQLLDSDNESMGILKTKMPMKEVGKAWAKYYNSDEPIIGVGNFIEMMQNKYKKYSFERIFLTDVEC